MTDKKKSVAPRDEKNSQKLKIMVDKNKTKHRKLAEVQFSSTLLNTITTQSFVNNITGEIDLTEAVAVMNEKSDKIIAGDLSELESTLTSQMVSLNAIFVTLAKRSTTCEYINQVEINLRLALKAQVQCIRTIEILAAIKNPPIIIAKQANISQGHQQINNYDSPTHA